MKVIFTNPSTNEPQVPIRRSQKTSTTQLKQALQKIKQTQLEVLKVLRTESQTSNLTQTEMKAITQNIESITNVNLLKIAQITNMRKDMERQKEKFSERLAAVNKKNQFLEQQLARWRQAEVQWVNERAALFQKLQILNLQRNQYTNSLKSEQQMKGMVINFQQELNTKNKEKLVLETEIQALHQKIIQLSQQKEKFRTRCDELNNELLEKQKKLMMQTKKVQERQRSAIPYDEIITQIKKISSNHSQIYNSLKTRSKITIQDLDIEEQIQQSLSKILRVIDFAQRAHLSSKKVSEDKSGKSESYSFGDEVKKLQKEMVQSEVLKNSIAQLKTQNWQLKQNNNELQNGIKKLEAKLKQYEEQLNNNRQNTGIFQLKQYNELIQELKKQMTKIRQEKQALATLVKKIGQNSIKEPSSNEGGMKLLRVQLDEIIALNGQLRNQNDSLKANIDALKLQIETLKFQERKYEEKLLQKHVLIEKEVKQKEYLISQLKRYEKISLEKESTLAKQQGKISELTATIQANFAKYQQELKFKMEESNALRQEIERHMKQNRQLREIAYDHQLLTKENDIIKKTMMHINPTIIHLWQIKEAQYANIDNIIATAKKS